MSVKEAYERLLKYDNKMKLQNKAINYRGDWIFIADVDKKVVAVPMYRVYANGLVEEFSMAVVMNEKGMQDFMTASKNAVEF